MQLGWIHAEKVVKVRCRRFVLQMYFLGIHSVYPESESNARSDSTVPFGGALGRRAALANVKTQAVPQPTIFGVLHTRV